MSARYIIDAHTHVHPDLAGEMLEIMQEREHFYATHRRFFETGERQIEYPGFPLQGRWKVDAVNLSSDALEKLYFRNAQRLIPSL